MLDDETLQAIARLKLERLTDEVGTELNCVLRSSHRAVIQDVVLQVVLPDEVFGMWKQLDSLTN